MTSSQGLLLGVDLGTSGVKTLLLRDDGTVAGIAVAPLTLSTPRPGWSEQDPAAWWAALRESLRSLLTTTGVDARTIAGVAMSGQMHGAVLLDKAGEVVRPCILWNDQRSAPQCDWITNRVGGRDALLGLVANPALAGFTAPKLLWVREHEPEVWSRVATVVLPKDYLVYKLTGELGSEASDASGTLLFDVRRRVWSDEMLALLDLPRTIVPICRESSDRVGVVTDEAADACGLAAGTPVMAGGADNACAAVGAGVINPGRLLSSIGTSGTLVAPTAAPEVDPGGRAHTFCHAAPSTWYVMGVMLSAGGALSWFGETCAKAVVLEAEKTGRNVFDLLLEGASSVPAGAEGLLFLPYLSGERTPHGDPNARGVFCGLSLRHTTAHLTRAVVEGVTFGLRDSLDIVTSMGVAADQIYAVGGGARSPFWRQLQADILGVPVVPERGGEGPALGAALLAGVGVGTFTLEEGVSRAVAMGESVSPRREEAALYTRLHPLYVQLYGALKTIFPLVNAAVLDQ